MAVSVQDSEFLNFVAGLNTEASYFTFPPNTWKEGDNIVPQINGQVRRRLAIDYENLFATASSAATADEHTQWAYGVSVWNSVAGNGDRNFFVVQIGPVLHFYDAIAGTVSGTKRAFTYDMSTHQAAGNPSVMGSSLFRTVSADGKLVIVSADTDPIYLTYDTVGDSVSATAITVQIRDFEGLDESPALTIDQRPTTLSTTHNYNLLNQGWYATQRNAYFTATGTYPSNAQTWIYGKNASGDFDSTFLNKIDFGVSPAPKGRYILNLFNKDRSTASGVVGITTEVEAYRFTATAFFAGRAWFAGIPNSTKLASKVYFSQVLTDVDKIGKCYQDQDPTSEVFNDLVDTDGGEVSISDAGEIVALYPISNGVLVFSNNGVWKVGGTNNEGFSARNFEVVKITNFGCNSPDSIVSTDYGVMFWSASGIYSIIPDTVGKLEVSNLSETIIQTLYNNIESLAKKYAVGAFNASSKRVYWLYTDDPEADGVSYRYKKNRVLVFDLRLKCFYTLSFNDIAGGTSPHVYGVAVARESSTGEQTFTVVDSAGDTVLSASLDTVGITQDVPEGGNAVFKFLSIVYTGGNNVFTFADLINQRDAPSKWKDWYSYDNAGTGWVPYFITGYNFSPTGPSKAKQALYITTYLNRSETEFDGLGNAVNESSVFLEPRWDFTDTTAANKIGTAQQTYRVKRPFIAVPGANYDNGYPVVITKNKVRGRGKALQLKFYGEADKDMHLIGWSVPMIGNTNV